VAEQQPTPRAEEPRQIVVSTGTSIPVILSNHLSSYKSQPGDEFEGSVAAPIIVDGEDVIPKGARVRGTVVSAKKQGAIKGEALLSVRLTNIHVHGRDYPITTNAYAAAQKGKGKRSAIMTGGGAAVGALIGGLAGGGKGAGIGAAVGAGGGLAASAGTGGQNVELPAESRLTFKLSEPLTVER
jgi:microcompartment protein CcmK/EutM